MCNSGHIFFDGAIGPPEKEKDTEEVKNKEKDKDDKGNDEGMQVPKVTKYTINKYVRTLVETMEEAVRY